MKEKIGFLGLDVHAETIAVAVAELDIITTFHVSLETAAFLPFAFFIAYGVMSIPPWGYSRTSLPPRPLPV